MTELLLSTYTVVCILMVQLREYWKMLKSSMDTHRRSQFIVREWGRRIEVLQLYISQLNPIRLVTVINIYSS